ncbi:DNA polymerase III subunit gamma/tau [Limnohabitans planktonicus]|uniref:DNA polymerase III subunit gamma/tau n=1 Tax=Limnohabitans planktonicus II-D5 TaxID=1293045 RepID=A0A2T7UCX4_9BURK|nr:DNA polymerase III subunit gamma/tau [Limnohabitans planktonicus]PVE42471.1 DNA polymerase III, subunit gamma and tau [Limnohabitans planktonicus II-D5]|eukprot:gene19427-22086_t
MSYLVLARKYRPRNFTEMVGQEHVVQALTNALVQQRLHHAYLFTGTRGVGKTTVSRILAKSLNCQGADGQGGITAEPCGVCQACRDIDSGRFVDYTELDAASNRGVDEVQSLLEQAVYKPVQGRFKVFMIDEVHMLTNTAFNAMLKTLEEPPEYLKFVLATTDPQKVPVTVLSRCLQFNLRPMAPETVFEHLTQVLVAEQLSAEPLALRLLSRAARGSMRDALSLTDQAIAFGNGQLQEAGVRQMLGSVDRSHVLQLIRSLAEGDGATVVAHVNALRLQGVSAAATLEDMAMLLQRMAVMQMVPGMAQDGDDPDAQGLADLADLMPAEETQLLYSLCLHGRTELGLAPDEYAALTMVLLRLLAFKPQAGLAEKKSPRNSVKPLTEAVLPAPQAVKPPSQAVQPPSALPNSPSAQQIRPPASEPPKDIAPGVPNSRTGDTGSAASTPPTERSPASRSQAFVGMSPVVSTPLVPPSTASGVQHRPASGPTREPAGAPAPDVSEPPPWEDMPEVADYEASFGSEEAVDGFVASLSGQESHTPGPKIRVLPVRESSSSSRVDVPKPAAVVLEPTPQGDAWFEAVQGLIAQEVITALVRELALQSQLVAREGAQWLLRVEQSSLNHPASRERLQAALQAAGHGDLRLNIEQGAVTDSPSRRLAVAAAAKMVAATALIENDPLVLAMVRDFGAKIVPGSIKVI